ncbi:hypothetical protein NQ318_006150 [Aromia moschata]|uniref:Calcineurin-like phosphoesterase domain-containing protein n=1 Tax=Aromia moschata TaxID=1265417 RepID=A0AAV8XLP1_9CUCU|nr:hypothetical protein NQ318_006150 [Aromia moschata]
MTIYLLQKGFIPNVPVLKVLHLSDTHFTQIMKKVAQLIAKNYFVAETTVPHLEKNQHHQQEDGAHTTNDIDYVIWTGDLPPHDIWKQSRRAICILSKRLSNRCWIHFLIYPYFRSRQPWNPYLRGSFAPPWMKEDNHSINWLYTTIADQWKRWLPEATSNTILRGGFYSVLLKPGFRLISLNTNYCHSLSWWLLVNSTDPAKELKWLINELQEAENKNEKVHLIGHIPPGSSDCMKVWSRNFYSIVDRFQATISAQFYGHSHADEFEVFYETAEYSRPTSVAYLGPSVTTYENYNPAYRIYYLKETMNNLKG